VLRRQIISQIIRKSSTSNAFVQIISATRNAFAQRSTHFRSTLNLSLNAQQQRRFRSTATAAFALNGAFARNAFARSGQF
jgi:hypothetical protein